MSSDNVIDPDAFDAIYLKGIQASNRMASTPTERRYYNFGFNQAIILLDQYFLQEKIDYPEARIRLKAIMEVMEKEGGTINKPAKAKAKAQRDPSGKFIKS